MILTLKTSTPRAPRKPAAPKSTPANTSYSQKEVLLPTAAPKRAQKPKAALVTAPTSTTSTTNTAPKTPVEWSASPVKFVQNTTTIAAASVIKSSPKATVNTTPQKPASTSNSQAVVNASAKPAAVPKPKRKAIAICVLNSTSPLPRTWVVWLLHRRKKAAVAKTLVVTLTNGEVAARIPIGAG